MMEWISAAFAGGVLTVSAWIDKKSLMIPLFLPMLLLAVGLVLRLWEGAFPECLWGMLPGAVLLLCVLGGFLQLGPGDGLMLLALGVWESAGGILLLLLGALFLAAVWGVLWLWKDRKSLRREYPFLPFLLICFWGRFLW